MYKCHSSVDYCDVCFIYHVIKSRRQSQITAENKSDTFDPAVLGQGLGLIKILFQVVSIPPYLIILP